MGVGRHSAEKRWDLDGEGDGGAEREAERGLLVGSSEDAGLYKKDTLFERGLDEIPREFQCSYLLVAQCTCNRRTCSPHPKPLTQNNSQ